MKPADKQPGEAFIKISHAALVGLQRSAEKLSLCAKRVISRSSGSYLSHFKGRGMEFADCRIYQPGDDVRSLDWRVTARTGRPHTKLYREEQERAVLLWVDFRLPMHFATRGQFKSVLACRLSALLAWAARKQGDRLGGLVFAEQGHQELRPRRGAAGVLQMLHLLAMSSARRAEASTAQLRQQVAGSALLRLRRLARPGSLIVLVSDFRDLAADYEVHLAALARHNDLVLLQVQDRLERILPGSGRYPLSDGQHSVLIDAADDRQSLAYRQRADQQQDALLALCRRYRIHHLYCATDDDPLAVLVRGFGGGQR